MSPDATTHTVASDAETRRSAALHITTPHRVAWANADLQGGGRRFEPCSAHEIWLELVSEARRGSRESSAIYSNLCSVSLQPFASS
jgi:hypothetical protein